MRCEFRLHEDGVLMMPSGGADRLQSTGTKRLGSEEHWPMPPQLTRRRSYAGRLMGRGARGDDGHRGEDKWPHMFNDAHHRSARGGRSYVMAIAAAVSP